MEAADRNSTELKRLALTITAACYLVSCKRTKMYAMISAGQVEACKVGRRTLVTRRSLEALVERGVAAAQQTWPR